MEKSKKGIEGGWMLTVRE